MRTQSRCALQAALLLFISAPASAVTIDSSTAVAAVSGLHAGLFDLGDSIHIHAEVDDAVPDDDPTVGVGVFPGVLTALEVTLADSLVFEFDAGPGFVTSAMTIDDAGLSPNLYYDSVSLLVTVDLSANPMASLGTLGGQTVFLLTVGLASVGPAPDLVVNDEIAYGHTGGLAVGIDLHTPTGVTSVANFIPEPTTATLLGLGLGLVGLAMRRRRLN